jgi:hypothetical protein
MANKRNTDLAFLIGGNDDKMDKETRAWYDAHRQDILRPMSTASSSPSTSTPAAATPAVDDASPPDSAPDNYRLVYVSIAELWLIRSPNYWTMPLCSGKMIF